jgi:hypothetical protein
MNKLLPLALLAALAAFAAPFAIGQATPADTPPADAESAGNLKGIDRLSVEVDAETNSLEEKTFIKTELADLLELELRRANIQYREMVFNQPDLNFPRISVKARIDRRTTGVSYTISLKIVDHATIIRNGRRITAETYVRSKVFTKGGDASPIVDVKTEVRDMTRQFVEDYRSANPR